MADPTPAEHPQTVEGRPAILPLNPPVICEVWDFEDAPGEFVKAHAVLVDPETGDPTGVIVQSERHGRFLNVPEDRYQFAPADWQEPAR
jgi:hypothetical protein